MTLKYHQLKILQNKDEVKKTCLKLTWTFDFRMSALKYCLLDFYKSIHKAALMGFIYLKL